MGWRVVFLILCSFAIGCGTESTRSKEYTPTERARMYLEIANGALAQNDPTGALQALVQAEKFDNTLPELFHSKALAYYGKHDLDTAIASARKAVSLRADYSDANNTLGTLLLQEKQFDEAIPPLMSAARDVLYRDSYKAWTNLGILKYRLAEYHQAQVFFDHAILDAPEKSCGAYYYRGQILQKERKLDAAIEDFRRATKRFCARFGEAELALGLAYQKKREYTLARKTFLEIHERYPNMKVSEEAMAQLRFLP